MSGKFEIPWEAAEAITLQALKQDYAMAKEDVDAYYSEGKWMHRDDLENQCVLMHHLKAVINYYGGSVG